MQKVDVVVVLRHLGVEREIVALKASGQNFYVFPPYAKKPIGAFDGHMSWHESGERHATVRLKGRQGKAEAEFQKNSIVKFCPPAELNGVFELYHSGILLGQLQDGFPIETNEGQIELLDGTAAGFRDDFICIRVYAVSPGTENQIQIFPDTGPRILHLVKETVPWLAVEVYQERVKSPVQEEPHFADVM
jgi:hypothetical protein